LICAVNNFDGSVLTSTDYIFGVLGGRVSAQNGITGIKCLDSNCVPPNWTSLSVSSEFASHSEFSFYVLEDFVEGGDHIDEPRNLLLMGQGYDGIQQFDPIILILDSSFTGKRYDLFSGGYLGDSSAFPKYPGAIRDFWQEQGSNLASFEYFSRVGGQQIAENCQNTHDWTHGICDPPHFLDCCDTTNQWEGIVTTHGAIYDTPEGGSYIINSMNITEITSITKIIRNSVTKFLIGGFITKAITLPIMIPPFDTVGKLYELTAGPPPAYTIYSSCPYDSSTFLSILGITLDVSACKNDDDYELFDESIDMVRHGDNVLIGVNGLNYISNAPAGPCTGPGKYDDGTHCWVQGSEGDNCDVTCRDNADSSCVGWADLPGPPLQTWNDTHPSCSVLGGLGFNCAGCALDGNPWMPGVQGTGYSFLGDPITHGPVICYVRDLMNTSCRELEPSTSRACACNLSDFSSSTSKIPWFLYTPYNSISTTFSVPAFGLVSASDLDNYNLTDILSDEGQVYLLMANSSETKIYNLTVNLSTAVIGTVNSDTLSGFYGKTMAMKDGILYVGGKYSSNARIYKYIGNTFDTSYSFTNGNYPYVEQLTNFTDITHKQPYCSSGCNKILSRGECTELVLKLENTDCDISSYSQGTSFTLRLNIGRYFQDLQIFTKKGFDSDEVGDTIA
jgi:hypothetical protein